MSGRRVRWLPLLLTAGVAWDALAAGPAPAAERGARRYNVVLIVCDDLNDYAIGLPGDRGHPQALTPQVEKLAASGVAFRRAYSNFPICAPSRSSFLTGVYPHASGNFGFDPWYDNPVLKNCKTLMEYFRENGYRTLGSGKLMHHLKADVWDEFAYKADYGPFAYDGKERVAHPSVPKPFAESGPVDGSFASLACVPFADDGNPESGWIYGEWGKSVKPFVYTNEQDRSPTPDERNADWAARRIRELAAEAGSPPFFLGVGFIRPHTPLHVPQKYYDLYPPERVALPVIQTGDAEDTHYRDVFDAEIKGLKYFRLLKASYPDLESGLRTFTRAYLACVSAVDDCIGRVVEAVDACGLKENTIIVLTSDHGWNMGQKESLFKNSLWEESTRVPLIIRAPGMTKPGGVAEHPVALIDLYPTLADLCGLKGDTRKGEGGARLGGHSLRPFLEDPACESWSGPDAALSLISADGAGGNDPYKQHWSVRTRRWRYIRYSSGAEELYDHDRDPREWVNLAGSAEHAAVKRALRETMVSMQGDMKTYARPAQAWDWFKAVDADKNGAVTREEWLAWCRQSDRRNGRAYDEASRKQAFDGRDQNKDGTLSRAELERPRH